VELSQLISFFHTVQFGSISRAAEVVYRTQSAVSQQIKALENELGCQLFSRIGKRRLVTTDEGKRLYEFTRNLLDEIDNTLEDIHAISGGDRGHISISAPFTTCFQVLPEKIKRFSDQHPKVIVSVFDQPQETAIAMVRNGEVDFAITLDSIVPKGFHSILWKQVTPVLIVPIGHPLLERRNITIKDIVDQDLIMPPSRMRHPGRSMLEKYTQKAGIALKVVLESSNVELSSRFVEKGVGISFATIIESLHLLEGRALKFISIDHLLPGGKMAITMRSEATVKGARANFLKTLLEM